MGRRIDEDLWEAWRARLARSAQWAGTVAAFCDREGVSVAAFYQWRRKLASGRARDLATWGRAAQVSVPPRFLPVRITRAEPVELELPNSVRVRVPVGAEWTLEAVLAAAARCDATLSGAEARAC